jgi:cytochrome c556
MKFLIGAALVGGTMTIAAGAQAYWGAPWGGPWSEPGWGGGPWTEPGWGGGPWTEPGWGGGPWAEPDYPYSGYGQALDRTHARQREMRDHRAAMRSVARMLAGQRSFDRAKAIGLAREIEASSGENLMQLFQPGDWQMSPLSRARIGDDMETFEARAEALKEAAAALADALEKQPGGEATRAGRPVTPGWGIAGPYSRRGELGAVTPQVFEAYTTLRATCHGCHADFRSAWR